MRESWKPIVGWEGLYEVSDAGRVKRVGKGMRAQVGRIKEPTLDACGYARVSLCRGGWKETAKVHRLVLAAFVEPRGPEWTANHKNGVRHDNRLSNLEYLSHVDNCRYSADVLKNYNNRGENNPRAKITSETAKAIRALASSGRNGAQIARDLKLNKHCVYDVLRGRSWAA